MKVRWANTTLEAAKLLKEYDAVLIHDKPGQPVLILFGNENDRRRAQKAIGGRTDGEYEGYPALSSEAPNLFKRLQRA